MKVKAAVLRQIGALAPYANQPAAGRFKMLNSTPPGPGDRVWSASRRRASAIRTFPLSMANAPRAVPLVLGPTNPLVRW